MNINDKPVNKIRQINNLRELITQHNAARPDSTAFTYRAGGEVFRVTYLEFARQTRNLGEFLLQRYCKSHIAIIGENSYEWLAAYFAITNSGNVTVPIDAQLPYGEIVRMLEKSDSVAVFCSEMYGDVAQELKSGKDINITVYSLGMLKQYEDEGERLIAAGGRKFDNERPAPEQTATIVFTSGTTGESKGVILTHKNLCTDIYYTCSVFGISGGTVALLPFHHIFGLAAGIMMVYHYGQSIHISHSLKYIQKDLQEFKPQILFLVPLYVESFYKRVLHGIKKNVTDDKEQLIRQIHGMFGDSLRYIICGGAPLAPDYVRKFMTFGIEIFNGYGMTECASIIGGNVKNANRIGSIGRPLPCCEVSISDEGEILVKGDNVMKGYYNDAGATQAAFCSGWLRTGDIGYFDEDNYLYIQGRSKNLIILSNGENVSPEQAEAELYMSEYITEVVVYGDNNCLAAHIYSRYGTEAQDKIKEFMDIYNQSRPAYRQIRKIVFSDTEFDKTPSGKIKRQEYAHD